MGISIVNVKKSIVDNILKIVAAAGGALVVIVYIRDVAVNNPFYNTIANVCVYFLLSFVLLSRKLTGYETKTWIIVLAFIFLGVKSFLIHGISEYGFNFFIFSAIIAVLILEPKHARLVVIITSVAYVGVSALFTFDVIESVPLQYNLSIEKITWFGRILMYVLLLLIVLTSIGRLQASFQESIRELNESNEKLNQYNSDLRSQLEYSRSMENKVKEKDLNFKKLFDESSDGIVVCDAEGRIIEVNSTVATLLNFPRAFLIGKHSTNFVIAEDRRIISQLSIDKIHSAKIREMHLVDKTNARIPVEVNYSRIFFNDQKSILVMIRDIRDRKDSEQRILNAVIQAEENERSRFAKDLHDDLGPVLSSIKMYIQSMRTPADTSEKKDLISRLISAVDDAIKSIRKIAYNLSSHLLQNEGLINALSRHIERISGNSVAINFRHDFKDGFRLIQNIEIATYRVLLELINNSLIHARCDQIDIDLRKMPNHFTIHYSDNGIGFNVDKMLRDNSKGIGLRNIVSRIKSINGLINFETKKTGFSLSIEIDIQE